MYYKNQLHNVGYCEKHTKNMHMLCAQNEETSTVKTQGTVSRNVPPPTGS